MRKHVIGTLALCFSQLALAVTPLPLEQVQAIEARSGGRLGVALYSPKSHQMWSYKGAQSFPLMSTFKPLACAKLLKDASKGALKLEEEVEIRQRDLVSYSPVVRLRVGSAMSLAELCATTLETSDNAAANLILKKIGGPDKLTAFLRTSGDTRTQLDRNEPSLNFVSAGDRRDSSSPETMARTLSELILGDVLDGQASAQLSQWMAANRVSDSLLRAHLPKGWKIIDKSGYDDKYGSRAIIAVVWNEVKEPLVISVYLGQSGKSLKEVNATLADMGKLIFSTQQ